MEQMIVTSNITPCLKRTIVKNICQFVGDFLMQNENLIVKDIHGISYK